MIQKTKLEDAKLIVILPSPSKADLKKKRLAVDRAGSLLRRSIGNVGIPDKDVYFTSVFKDTAYPSFKKLNSTHYHKLYSKLDKAKSCNMVIPVGKIPLHMLTGQSSAKKWQGSIIPAGKYKESLKCMPITHPKKALGFYTARYDIIMALDKASKRYKDPEIKRKKRNYILNPSYNRTINLLKQCEGVIGFDIETSISNQELSAFAIALNDKDVFCVPLITNKGLNFTLHQEYHIMTELEKVLNDESITKILQNASFDTTFLYRKYGIVTNNIEDTYIAEAFIYPDLPRDLGVLTARYTHEPYFKDSGDVKNQLDQQTNFWLYNAKDAVVLHDIFESQKETMKTRGLHPYYRFQVSMLPILTFIETRGFNVDVEKRKQKAGDLKTQAEGILNQIIQHTGHPNFNPNSPKQVGEYFYDEIGLKEYKNQSRRTTDEEALKRISRKGYEEARLILDYRGKTKLRSTYIVNPIDDDNRYRGSFNPVGTISKRFSSSKPLVTQKGGNIQNLPKAAKEFLIPDKGYIMYEVDLAQAENRIVAALAQEPNMLEAFQQGKDVHSITAGEIFGKPASEISAVKGSCQLGTGKDSERDWGKKANHAFNYDLSANAFALKYEMPVKQGKEIYNAYHNLYPGIKNTFYMEIQRLLKKNRTLINFFGRPHTFLERWGSVLFRQAYSWIPQSSVTELLNRKVFSYVYHNPDMFSPIEILNQVHDSVVFQIPRSVPIRDHLKMLEQIKKNTESHFFTYKGHSFNIPLDCEVYIDNWKSGVELEEWTLEELKNIVN